MLNVLTTATQLSDLCLDFTKNRPSLPPLVLITPHDHKCPPNSPLTQRSPWTSSSAPSPPVAYRLQQLAGEALNVLSGLLLDAGSIDMDTAKVCPAIFTEALPLWMPPSSPPLTSPTLCSHVHPSPPPLPLSQQVFRTPLQDFHVLIHLNRKHVPRSHQAVDALATPSSPHVHHKYTHLPVVDFDPVQLYLKELEVLCMN